MCPDRRYFQPISFTSQRGAGLPVALFIITVLALIVATMAQLQQGSGQAVSLQIQSQRAFLAAESGAQLGVFRALESANCSSTTINFSAASLQSCSAIISCTSTTADIDLEPPDEPDQDETVYTLESIGTCGAGNDLARRTVEVRVR